MTTMIVPADQPSYVPMGGNEIMLLGEFSRTITVDCRACRHEVDLKLIADEILEVGECDELLDAYLQERGWSVVHDHSNPFEPDDYQFCPACSG